MCRTDAHTYLAISGLRPLKTLEIVLASWLPPPPILEAEGLLACTHSPTYLSEGGSCNGAF